MHSIAYQLADVIVGVDTHKNTHAPTPSTDLVVTSTTPHSRPHTTAMHSYDDV